MAAPITGFNMAAECGGAAYFNAFHDLVLLSIHRSIIPVLYSISSEDIGHLRRFVIVSHLSPPAAHPSGRADS
jgi:hypothetical protein